MAAFWWEQPAWLVVVFALASALSVHARMGRSAARGWEPAESARPAAAAGGTEQARATVRRLIIRWAASLLGGACAVGLGWGLVYVGTSAALVLLGALTVVAAAWLTTVLHRRQRDRLSPFAYTALCGLRCSAWVILLAVLARPAWDWVVVDWRKPLLVVLLDQSESMALVDSEGQTSGQTRGQLANAAIRRARPAIARLGELYELRLRGVGASHVALRSWRIVPHAPASALASAAREAGAMRGRHGAGPPTVLLLSDGAENVEPAGALRQAAADLAAQGSALFTVGVGPLPGETPLVELEPLVLPPRLGLRDRLRVPVSARVQGCAGAALTIELLWGAEPAAVQALPVDYDVQHVSREFDLMPPAPGLHRLTAQVTFPEALGGIVFQTAAIVEVHDEGIRVLWLEGTPRAEAAFVTRALRGAGELNVVCRFLYAEAGRPADSLLDTEEIWSDYDVVVLGSIPVVFSDALVGELARAVWQRGVGLLLAGGRRLFNDGDYAADTGVGRYGAALGGVSPVEFVSDEFGLAGPVRVVPTDAGLRHPVLLGAGAAEDADRQATQPDERATWQALPALGGAALFGDTKAAAVVLAEDGAGRPLLVAQEVGRGRCVAAAWESTWPWALASDEGAVLHRRLWRQLMIWLANRRPRAWVLTDEPTYPLAALAAGQRRVQIQAGLSGLETSRDSAQPDAAEARLVLMTPDERRELRLEQRGQEWTAELPRQAGDVAFPAPGEYVLEFSVGGVGTGDLAGSARGGQATRAAHPVLEARTSFSIVQTRLEQRPPTANLALLQAAAEETATQGGSYYPLHALPELLARLTQTDRRQEVRTRLRYGAVEREPWVLLAALVALLSLEWAVRKRAGLA